MKHQLQFWNVGHPWWGDLISVDLNDFYMDVVCYSGSIRRLKIIKSHQTTYLSYKVYKDFIIRWELK